MPEEGWGCTVRRSPWKTVSPYVFSVILFALLAAFCFQRHAQQPPRLERLGEDVAELQLNLTGPRLDPRLCWQAGPALGRSFQHGPQLVNGQLLVVRDGIYRLHIQVTLANCSSVWTTVPPKATLIVGICSPDTHRISLLRLNFHQGCTVTSQRLTPLALGDTLCTNLTLSLLPSQNADETFFGIQWVHT
ncbi:CD70 antigen [Marmota flaviventris]|uniref:CD70 antigen n=1 Tax=Marmota flaviventris TaxID=93162 RepID=UPI000FFF79DC|nr:CD70 antigen [Marmota flaviventris]XP_027808556.1 CD70 antigen [Marmota flaviventris]